MKREQVAIAVAELQRAFRGSRTLPHEDTWYSTLAHCETDLVVTAIARLIDTRKTAPTIADFREEYALAERQRVPEPKPDGRCEHCDGTGWVEGPEIPYQPSKVMLAMVNDAERAARADRELWIPPRFVRSSVVPCIACPTGKRRK